MGAVYFFDEALPVDKLRSIYALGPNYTYFFERASIDLRHHDDDRVDMDPNTEPALDGSLTSHLMLAYNPSVHEGDAFLDNDAALDDDNEKDLAIFFRLSDRNIAKGTDTARNAAARTSGECG